MNIQEAAGLQPGQMVLMGGTPHIVEDTRVVVDVILQRVELIGDRLYEPTYNHTPVVATVHGSGTGDETFADIIPLVTKDTSNATI